MSCEITHTNYKAITSISKIYMAKCQEMSAKFSAMLAVEDHTMASWLYIASIFFKFYALWGVWN